MGIPYLSFGLFPSPYCKTGFDSDSRTVAKIATENHRYRNCAHYNSYKSHLPILVYQFLFLVSSKKSFPLYQIWLYSASSAILWVFS